MSGMFEELFTIVYQCRGLIYGEYVRKYFLKNYSKEDTNNIMIDIHFDNPKDSSQFLDQIKFYENGSYQLLDTCHSKYIYNSYYQSYIWNNITLRVHIGLRLYIEDYDINMVHLNEDREVEVSLHCLQYMFSEYYDKNMIERILDPNNRIAYMTPLYNGGNTQLFEEGYEVHDYTELECDIISPDSIYINSSIQSISSSLEILKQIDYELKYSTEAIDETFSDKLALGILNSSQLSRKICQKSNTVELFQKIMKRIPYIIYKIPIDKFLGRFNKL